MYVSGSLHECPKLVLVHKYFIYYVLEDDLCKVQLSLLIQWTLLQPISHYKALHKVAVCHLLHIGSLFDSHAEHAMVSLA
jgi:hypothetical protein